MKLKSLIQRASDFLFGNQATDFIDVHDYVVRDRNQQSPSRPGQGSKMDGVGEGSISAPNLDTLKL